MRSIGRGYALAVAETAAARGHTAVLGEELRSFLDAMRNHDDLRQVLTDPAVTTLTRQAVVSDLLAERGLEETASLVGFLVRTERPADLPSVLAHASLAVSEDAHVEGEEAEAATAGRVAARDQLRGYAERVLQELRTNTEVDEVEDELFRFARLLDAEPALRSVLANGSLPVEGRTKVLEDLLAGKVRPTTVRLARFVLHTGRLRDLVGVFEWLVELVAAERGRRVAEARTAVPLDDAETSRLAAALGRLVGRTVEVRVVLDPSVVGGMLVSVGDLRIDGTIRSRLDKLREALAGSS